MLAIHLGIEIYLWYKGRVKFPWPSTDTQWPVPDGLRSPSPHARPCLEKKKIHQVSVDDNLVLDSVLLLNLLFTVPRTILLSKHIGYSWLFPFPRPLENLLKRFIF